MSIALQRITRKEALATIQTMIESGNILEDIKVTLGETIFKLKKEKKATEFTFFGNNNSDVLMKTDFEKEEHTYTLICVNGCISFDDGYCIMYKTPLEKITFNDMVVNQFTDSNKETKWLRCQGCKVANNKNKC